MTLYTLVNIFKKIALDQPNIRTTSDGSVYDALNNNPSVKYDVFHISQTNHQEDFETDYYGLQLFYISRLEDSLEDNRLQIQSIGKEVLGNIIRTFCENFSIDYPTITYIPFTQKFNDLTAGQYCNVRLEVPKDLVCADDYVAEVVPGSGIKLQNIGITITENGLRVITPGPGYDGIGEIRIETDVPQSAAVLQDKEVEYTENGSYTIHPDAGYDGLSSVAVDVIVPQGQGYEEGYEDGVADQKAKLTVTSFTENNTYTREDGWSAVTINVPSDYQDGYDDGVADQKAKLSTTSVTENGTYTREDGYSAITVNVEDRYEEGYADGYEDGEAAQKAKLITITVTGNGVYERADGYSAVYVDVPERDLIANLQGDYFVIPSSTTHLRDYAFYKTCFSSITIPTTVSAIGDYAFAENTCLTSMTIPSSVTEIGSYVFNGDSALTEMTFNSLVPPTLEDTGTSLGSTAYTFPIYVPCQSIDAYKSAFGTAYAPRIQCIPTPPAAPTILDFIYSSTTDNQMITLFGGDSQTDDTYFWDFYDALIKMEIDGVEVEKDPSHIARKDPDINDPKIYWYIFPTSGTHNVKYYVSTTATRQRPSPYPYHQPGTTVVHLLFCADSAGHLVTATVGEGYEVLGTGCFGGQGGGWSGVQFLSSVILPSTLTEIGHYSMAYQPNLTTVTVKATVPPELLLWQGRDPFENEYGETNLEHIYVPSESVETYKSAPIWSKYSNIITAIS